MKLCHQAPAGYRDWCCYDRADIDLLRLLVLRRSISLLAQDLDSRHTQIAPVSPYPAPPPPTPAPPKEKRTTSCFKLHRHHEVLDLQQQQPLPYLTTLRRPPISCQRSSTANMSHPILTPLVTARSIYSPRWLCRFAPWNGRRGRVCGYPEGL